MVTPSVFRMATEITMEPVLTIKYSECHTLDYHDPYNMLTRVKVTYCRRSLVPLVRTFGRLHINRTRILPS